MSHTDLKVATRHCLYELFSEALPSRFEVQKDRSVPLPIALRVPYGTEPKDN